jgi:hypothetical protein
MAANVWDQAARYAAKLDAPGFCRWLLEGAVENLSFTRWLETQTIPFPGEPDRRCDTVAETHLADGLGPPWAVVVEFQTEPDADMQERLLEYLGRLRREVRHGPHGRDRYPVAALLVNLTGTGPGRDLDMVLPGPAKWGTWSRVGGADLVTVDAAATLARIAADEVTAALLPWLPLMRGAGEPAVIAEWVRLAQTAPNSRRRQEYGTLAGFFADLVPWRQVWKNALESWNMHESEFLKEWVEKYKHESPFLKELREKDRTEGRVEGMRTSLLRVLRSKAADPLPGDLVAAIEAQGDADELSRWFDLALTAPSLEQFRQALPGGGAKANGTSAPPGL